MKNVYGYIRVSTVKQGTGVSLQEQKESIFRYAEKNQLNIVEWFEEQETAAKQGRPKFSKMIKLLRVGKTQGVIIHKIDRSARNLKDWAALGDLIDEGVEVHFAHESLDMETRGGRLAADIQAVIASDYIRNLRDETRKGLTGRLKQGIYPFGAPIGYLNNGRGEYKTIDPIKGPLIKRAFQSYASGKYDLNSLCTEMKKLGLKNTKDGILSPTTMSKILNNPFYSGVLRVKGKSFSGGHEPLITAGLFDQVQNILRGKTNARIIKNEFVFSKLIKCSNCNYSLIGEIQKGHVYYRCHTRDCQTKCVRQEKIEEAVINGLEKLQFRDSEISLLEGLLEVIQGDWSMDQISITESINLQQGQINQKLERLTDAYIENTIDKTLFEIKKEKLLIELNSLRSKSQFIAIEKGAVLRKVKNFLELLRSIKKSYVLGILTEKRKIVKYVTSNLSFCVSEPTILMRSPFYQIANRQQFASCDLDRDRPRTFVADLAIDPATKQADFSNTVSIDEIRTKENMKQLLDIIIGFFEEEQIKVDNGTLEEEDTLLGNVQEDNPSPKPNTRYLSPQFKPRRA